MAKKRIFPALQALMQGFSQEETQELEELFEQDADAYQAHLAKLASLGATNSDYRTVNSAIKKEMRGIGRGDRDVFDTEEMETRIIGRSLSRQNTHHLSEAVDTAKESFRTAREQTGWGEQ